MRFTKTVLPLLLTIGWLVAAPAPAEKEQTDLDKFKGDWVVVSPMIEQPDGGLMYKGDIFRITGDKLEFIKPSGDGKKMSAILKLDPKKTPKEFDLEEVRKDEKNRLFKGIYAIDGDTLTLCWSATEGGSRPSGFDKVGGKDELRIFVLERKKEKKE